MSEGLSRREFMQAGAALGGAMMLGGCTIDLRVTTTTREKLQEMCDRILKLSPADETMVRLTVIESSLTRFANNVIHQNVSEESTTADITLVVGSRATRVTTNRLDDASLRAIIERGMATAKRLEPIADYLPMLGPQEARPAARFDSGTAEATPDDRGRQVGRALNVTKRRGLTAAGMLQTTSQASALANSKGLFASHRETNAGFSITSMAADSSGWAQASSQRLSDIDAAALAERAGSKAESSRAPQAIDPGKHTVVLEPEAVADLLWYVVGSFDGRRVLEKRSFFTEKLGRKVFGDNVTIVDDAHDPRHSGEPFDGEGMPKNRLVLVEKGVLRNLVYDRVTAKRAGARPTGHGQPPPDYGASADHVILQGGDTTFENLIGGLEKGLLLTHLWYIRYLDRSKLTVTGMTRDGTFLIENGKITHGVRNLRFNVSIAELLNNIEAMTREARAAGIDGSALVCPAIRVKDFQFSSVTQY